MPNKIKATFFGDICAQLSHRLGTRHAAAPWTHHGGTMDPPVGGDPPPHTNFAPIVDLLGTSPSHPPT